ncbi:MAG: GatB/YqeY domain-containing protein [Candidatus Endonucleobacter sp. (ex Gigantidas childressi)]|nr:GatB/YqeY domain-containing protein [Candidatus Endonucleobacter sp. (ex Gigantidas childressi)]
MSECKVRERLMEAMKESMRKRNKTRLGIIRLALAELQQVAIDEKNLDDKRALAVLDKMVKQRRDSIKQFKSAGRMDLSDKEGLELEILQEFLPEQWSEFTLVQVVAEAITEVGAQSMIDMGKVMAIIIPKAQGYADMSVISNIVKSKLS